MIKKKYEKKEIKKEKKAPTLRSMTVLYRKRVFKRPKVQTQTYMHGLNDAKHYILKIFGKIVLKMSKTK